MRRLACVTALCLLFSTAISWADEPIKPEQLKKAYDDALVQLKAVQDRKAELAKENVVALCDVNEKRFPDALKRFEGYAEKALR